MPGERDQNPQAGVGEPGQCYCLVCRNLHFNWKLAFIRRWCVPPEPLAGAAALMELSKCNLFLPSYRALLLALFSLGQDAPMEEGESAAADTATVAGLCCNLLLIL
jgi:hypothetical protein